MNKAMLIGRLTRDPEKRQTQSGLSVTSFTLAVARKFKGANGEKEVDFINIVTWRQLADLCAQYLGKGHEACVIGSIQTRSYEDKDGNKRNVTEIVADEVEFLRKPAGAENHNSQRSYSKPQNYAPPTNEMFDDEELSDFEPLEDAQLPF